MTSIGKAPVGFNLFTDYKTLPKASGDGTVNNRNTAASDNIITDTLATNPFLIQQLSNPATRKEVRDRALLGKNGAIASGNSTNFDIFSGLYELTNMLETSPPQDTYTSSAKNKQKNELSEDVFNLRDDFLFA